MSVYYNDNDANCCQWLRNLIAAGHLPKGDVDERPIERVQPDDLRGYTQCHFFAGIGGWPLALRLAGWPDDRPVWTGSCPCQPFSVAGKRQGTSDKRHLWPEFRRLISLGKPTTVFGEQVASKFALQWLDEVFYDLEDADYSCGASDLPACSVNAPHVRQRLYWVADAASGGLEGHLRSTTSQVPCYRSPEALDPWHSTGSPFEHWQKLLAQPNVCRVDDGVSSSVDIRPRLRAYGNSICPQLAAQFIGAYMTLDRHDWEAR
jgi:DNA (cytosine-5)-methyltransferase 1